MKEEEGEGVENGKGLGEEEKKQMWWHSLVTLEMGKQEKADPWGLLGIQSS